MIGDIRKFRFWCQKVLPLVYDDSLSYYETLCKIVNYLNKVIEDVNSIPDYIDGVIEEKLDDEHLRELIAEMIRQLENAISEHNEGNNTNSSADYKIGDMLWLNNILYRVIRDIDAGDTFIVDTNIEAIDFETLFNEFIDNVKHDICSRDDGTSTTALESLEKYDWVWLNDELYRATVDITQGNAYVLSGDNANVEQITVEYVVKENAEHIGDLNDLDTTNKTSVVNAINEVVTDVGNEETARTNADNAIIGDMGALSNLQTTDKSSLVNAINEVATDVGNEETARTNADNAIIGDIGTLSNLQTTDKSSLVNAINEINSTGGGANQRLNNLKIYNVLDYGATGDGTTDDTTAINTVIAILNDGGGAMYFPKGTYNVTSLTPITNACEIFGVGSESIIKTTARSRELFNLSMWHNGYMHGLTFDDTSSNHIDPVIVLTTGNTCVIENIWLTHCNRFITLGRASAGEIEAYSSTVRNIFGHVYDSFAIIHGSRSCCYFNNCVIDAREGDSGAAAITIDDTNGLDTLIVTDCLFQVFAYGIACVNHNGITTSNFFIQNAVFDGITVRAIQVSNYGNLYRVYFDNCWFTMMDSSAYDNVLINNLSQSGGLVCGINFNACKFPYVYANAIYLNKVSGVKITNCVIPTYVTSAIDIVGCGGVVITGNYIGYDGTNCPQPTTPAIAGSTNQAVIVSGNYFQIASTITSIATASRASGNLGMADETTS